MELFDLPTVKNAARGHWHDIITRLTGIAPEILDSRNHPCPNCGGTDRYRAFNDFSDTGGMMCNQCFSNANGDGFAALAWLTRRNPKTDFPAIVADVARFLGVQPSTNGNGNGRNAGNGKAKPAPTTSDDLLRQYCIAKRITTPSGEPAVDALKKFGAKGVDGEIHIPQFDIVKLIETRGGKEAMCSALRQRADGTGKEWNAKGKPTGLFVPSRTAEKGDTVYFVEGPRTAAALVARGYFAIGTPGCKGFKRQYVPAFRGVNVVIIPDNDEPGIAGANRTARMLLAAAESVKIAQLPGPILASGGEDVRDILRQEGGEQAVRDAIANAKPYELPPPPAENETLSLRWPSGRTEIASGRRLATAMAGRMRYVTSWKSPIAYDGTRWVRDGADITLAAEMKAIIEDHWSELGDLITHPSIPAEEREEILKATSRYIKEASRANTIRAAITLSYSEPDVAVSHDLLDRDPWLLNCQNGTIDLRTGKLRPHDPADLITKITPIAYDPAAKCPTWTRTLDGIFAGNQRLILFLQRFAGYSLTGMTNERCLLFSSGVGRNGKTTVASTLQRVEGEYAVQITTDMLMVQRGQVHPTEVCDLHGVRMAVASETEEGRRMAESLVKQLTGGEDMMKGRRMKQDFWQFHQTHKLWLSGNHKPQIRGTDDAIWDRVKVVPFNVRFDKPDKKLPEKLQAELPGILNWAIQGCLEWQRDGLGEPDEVTRATSEYRAEQDVLGVFIAERCLLGPHLKVKAADLLKAYKQWCADTGEVALNQTKLGRQLTDRGFPAEKDSVVYRKGIDLAADLSGVVEVSSDSSDSSDSFSSCAPHACAGVEVNPKNGPNCPNCPEPSGADCGSPSHWDNKTWVLSKDGLFRLCPDCGHYRGREIAAPQKR